MRWHCQVFLSLGCIVFPRISFPMFSSRMGHKRGKYFKWDLRNWNKIAEIHYSKLFSGLWPCWHEAGAVPTNAPYSLHTSASMTLEKFLSESPWLLHNSHATSSAQQCLTHMTVSHYGLQLARWPLACYILVYFWSAYTLSFIELLVSESEASALKSTVLEPAAWPVPINLRNQSVCIWVGLCICLKMYTHICVSACVPSCFVLLTMLLKHNMVLRVILEEQNLALLKCLLS